MKKILAVSALALFLGLSGNSIAQQPAGGFTGPSTASISVADALKLGDDAPVVLTGKITKNLGGQKYLFTDETGSVTVEIGKRDWNGNSVNENDIVEISGEVDKDLMSFEIDVDSVNKK